MTLTRGIAIGVVALLADTGVYVAGSYALSLASDCGPGAQHGPNGAVVVIVALIAALLAVLAVGRLAGASIALSALMATVQLPLSVGVAYLPVIVFLGSPQSGCR